MLMLNRLSVHRLLAVAGWTSTCAFALHSETTNRPTFSSCPVVLSAFRQSSSSSSSSTSRTSSAPTSIQSSSVEAAQSSCRSATLSKNAGKQGRMVSSFYEPIVDTKKAAFGLQCFWHSEAHLASLPGVYRSRVGYAGGSRPEVPAYRNIGDYIETVEIDYDPNEITFRELLKQFYFAHDPTVKHKRQYISAIFYYDDQQKREAEESLKNEQSRFPSPIVTEVLPMKQFFNAEDYHQKYLLRCEKELYNSLGIDDQTLITSFIAAKLNAFVAGYGKIDRFDRESTNWGLNEHQNELARKAVLTMDGKPQGCGI